MSIPLLRQPHGRERRSATQLWMHYQIEKELAQRLKTAPRADRKTLYSSTYEELFKRVPDHPQLQRKSNAEHAAQVALQLRFLERFLAPDTVFLEIGAGDCALSFAVAKHVRKVYGLDVSAEITKCDRPPENFELILSDGTNIPVPPGSVDLAYSFQLMEHLQQDDAVEQLDNIYRALAPGGRYVCFTPNRMSGPHDISRYFDNVATGLHLKEYTAAELTQLFKRCGFRRIRTYFGVRGHPVSVPAPALRAFETSVRLLPTSLRNRLTQKGPVRAVLGLQVVATKGPKSR